MAGEYGKRVGKLYFNHLENHLRSNKYVNGKDVHLDERNNLLIDCFTVNRLGLELLCYVTNGWRVMETRFDFVLELSREPFEIEQISQWLKCAP